MLTGEPKPKGMAIRWLFKGDYYLEGFEGLECRWHLIEPYTEYVVTENGDVYSYRTDRGWQGLRKMSPRGRFNKNRYLQVCLSKDGEIKYLQIHRLVAKYFCEGYFDGAVVNHIDGNKHNNHYSNLEWVTQAENVVKSYETSGLDATRNYYFYNLINNDGEILNTFKGRNVVKQYIEENNLKISFSSLAKYGECNGYKLVKLDNSNSNDYPLGVGCR